MMNELLDQVFLGNTLSAYCWVLGILLTGLAFQRFLSKLLTRLVFKLVKKYALGVSYEKLLALLIKPFGVFIMIVTVYLAFDRLEFPQHWNLAPTHEFGIRMVLFKLFQVGIICSFTWIVLRIADFFGLVLVYRASLTESKADDQLIPFLKETVKIIISILSLFFILGSVFQLNIASLVAGLGIGGLAVALAAKESLENLLGSFTIFLDQPFVVGDLVQVGKITGHVERIGFRSTRIRTVEKSFVTLPNKKMIEGELDNLSQRTHRRAKFLIGFTYSTPIEAVKKTISELQDVLNKNSDLEEKENKVTLYELGTSSVNVLVQYYVKSADWNLYIKVREEINLMIVKLAQQNGAEFSVSTVTLNVP